MVCPQCQSSIPQDAQFCPRCGYPIAQMLAAQSGITGQADTNGEQSTPNAPYAPSVPSAPIVPPLYPAAPSQPIYTVPHSQPLYAPPSQPLYAPPSQPLYPSPSAPAGGSNSVPVAAFGGLLRSAPPNTAPANPVQSFIHRNISAPLATSPWFMAALGTVAALVSGLILTAIVEAIWSAALSNMLSVLSSSPVGQITSGMTQSMLSPDLLKFYLFEQHVPFMLHASASLSGTGGTADVTIGFPLTGLILIPAIALIIGGYLSSASDFTHNIRASLLRGALIAPFYAILLTILALMSASSVSASALGADVGVTLSASAFGAFLYGLLWGAIFGAIGGWLQFAGRRAISGALPTMREAQSRWMGAVAGGTIALGVGVLIATIMVVGLLPTILTAASGNVASSTTTLATPTLPLNGGNVAPLLLMLIVAFAPTAGATGFSIIAGAPYTSSGAGQSTSVGFLGASSHPSLGPVYLLLLIPIISYIIGGRVSARISGATRIEAAAVAGALIGIPGAILLAVLAYLLGFGIDANALGIVSESASATPSVLGAFVAGLLGGSIVGAIGGMSEVAIPSLGKLPRMLLLPLRPIGLAIDPVLDRISGHPHSQTRSTTRRWLYDAVLVAFVLVVLAIAINVVDTLPDPIIPFQVTLIVDAIVAALVIILPLLYFTGALVTLFSAPADKTPLASSVLPIGPLGAPDMPLRAYPNAPMYPGPVSAPLASPPGYYGGTFGPTPAMPPAQSAPPTAPATFDIPATGQPPTAADSANDQTVTE